MTGKRKDFLRKHRFVSPAGELRELMATLTNPSYLIDLHKEMKALTDPAYLTGMQAQVKALMNPAYLTGMQEQVKALTNPAYLRGMQEQVKTLTNPAYLVAMQEQVRALTNPAYLTGMQEQVKALTNPAYLTAMQEQVKAVTNPAYLAEMREQMAALTSRSYLKQMAGTASSGRMQAELSAVLGSYQELISGSALASFLVCPDATDNPPTQALEAESLDSLAVGDFADLDVGQVHIADLAIVNAISKGKVTALPPSAQQRIQSVYLLIVAIWDMLLRIFNTFVALGVLVALMSGASEPADVSKQAALLPNHERQLLADYRIVNRSGARLRAGPGTDFGVLVSLQLGMPVEVLEKSDKGWFFVAVEYQGEWIEGWIFLTVTTPIPPPQHPRGLLVDAGTSRSAK